MKSVRFGTALLTAVFLLTACGSLEEQVTESRLLHATQGVHPDSGQVFRTNLDALTLSGLSVHWVARTEPGEILLFEVDPDAFSPTMVAAATAGITPINAIQKNDLTILLGSGYAAHANSLVPVGLLKIAGQQISPLEPHGYTRILGFDQQKFGVVHRANYQPEQFTDAVQVGPGIIENGQLDISKKDLARTKYFRSFAALCDQRWLVGVTTAPSHLRTLGTDLLTFFEGRSWRCDEVVNFAGDHQAVLAVAAGDKILYQGDIDRLKVSFLGFRRR